MKRVISMLAVLVLCISLACPVFADEFVPSITDKNAPDIITIKDEEGKPAIGIINENGKPIDYVYGGCLVVTPVSQAKTSTLIPDDAEKLLLEVYDKLNNGSMQLPYEKISDKLDPKKMVIRDLFDASWLCTDHPIEVAKPGVTVELTFNLGVGKDTDVYVMTYKNNEWNPIVSVENNGDGTVTCVFEDFCPIAFAVQQGSNVPPSQTGDNASLTLWIVLLAVSALALVAVIVFRRKIVR